MLIILQRGKTVCVTVQSLHLNTKLQLQKWSWMLRKIQRYVCNSSENDKASAFSLVRVQPAQGKRQWRLGASLFASTSSTYSSAFWENPLPWTSHNQNPLCKYFFLRILRKPIHAHFSQTSFNQNNYLFISSAVIRALNLFWGESSDNDWFDKIWWIWINLIDPIIRFNPI